MSKLSARSANPEYRVLDHVEIQPVINRTERALEQPRMRRPCYAQPAPERPWHTWRQRPRCPSAVADAVDGLGPRLHIEIIHTLVLGRDPTGLLEWNCAHPTCARIGH